MLGTRLGQDRYVLKGGANLRYFFASERYSEDIDIDLIEPVPWSFKEQIGKVLDSPALARLLAVADLRLAEHRSAKQTSTTHRWMLGIEIDGRPDLIRSKVEFSNRGEGDGYDLAYLPAAVVRPYALRPPSVQHYGATAAIEQKVSALVGRVQTQSRDVFDLDLLLRHHSLEPGTIEPELLDTAVERAMEQDYATFRDQVLPFLEPEAAELISSPAAWEQIQSFVAESLEAAR